MGMLHIPEFRHLFRYKDKKLAVTALILILIC